MLQAISHEHDTHHARRTQNSLENLTASLRDGKTHLLLAASGSVATIKLPLIIRAFSSYPPAQLSIRVVLTPSASRFLAGQSPEQPTVSSLGDLPNVDGVYVDADEWREPWKRGSSILHIELRRWADLLVIAPLSANTMAKIVAGFADGILLSVVRAWDAWGELDSDVLAGVAADEPSTFIADQNGTQDQTMMMRNNRRITKKKRIIVACAMNTAMWRHPLTAKHLRTLQEEWGVDKTQKTWKTDVGEVGSSTATKTTGSEAEDPDGNEGWFEVLMPQQKTLACGDVGDGAMMEWTEIVEVIKDRLGLT